MMMNSRSCDFLGFGNRPIISGTPRLVFVLYIDENTQPGSVDEPTNYDVKTQHAASPPPLRNVEGGHDHDLVQPATTAATRG